MREVPSCNEILRNAALAAYASLQNGCADSAKAMLRTGLLGGDINNPIDIDRCNQEWCERYKKDRPKK